MSEFLRLLLDSIAYLWPFRIVWQYERGVYYVCGRYWRTVGPGCWPIVPFFMDVKTAGVVKDVLVTPLQSITTKDGRSLTFSATFTIEVDNLGHAYNRVMSWTESAGELASAILAEKLAEVGAEMLEPEKRGRLVSGCLTRLRAELEPFGLQVTTLRFNNFVSARVYRLFSDQTYNSR